MTQLACVCAAYRDRSALIILAVCVYTILQVHVRKYGTFQITSLRTYSIPSRVHHSYFFLGPGKTGAALKTVRWCLAPEMAADSTNIYTTIQYRPLAVICRTNCRVCIGSTVVLCRIVCSPADLLAKVRGLLIRLSPRERVCPLKILQYNCPFFCSCPDHDVG